MRFFGLLSVVMLAACTKQESLATIDAGSIIVVVADAGTRLTPEKIDAWVRWQDAVFALPPSDGGIRQRAKDEARLLSQFGLRSEDADAVEAVVAAVIAERNVAKISGAEALTQFKDGLKALPAEQRAKAETALNEVPSKAKNDALTEVEIEFGADAVRLVMDREGEVSRVWERVLEAQTTR